VVALEQPPVSRASWRREANAVTGGCDVSDFGAPSSRCRRGCRVSSFMAPSSRGSCARMSRTSGRRATMTASRLELQGAEQPFPLGGSGFGAPSSRFHALAGARASGRRVAVGVALARSSGCRVTMTGLQASSLELQGVEKPLHRVACLGLQGAEQPWSVPPNRLGLQGAEQPACGPGAGLGLRGAEQPVGGLGLQGAEQPACGPGACSRASGRRTAVSSYARASGRRAAGALRGMDRRPHVSGFGAPSSRLHRPLDLRGVEQPPGSAAVRASSQSRSSGCRATVASALGAGLGLRGAEQPSSSS
jgi:hypothetical protein